jgi:hypothetical protein
MKYKRKIISSIILTLILIMFPIIFTTGCESITPIPMPDPPNPDLNPPTPGPTSGWIIIENNAEITEDCTPLLVIYSEGADYMSLSGDGMNWTTWEKYSASWQEFNLANGFNGTTFSSGIKYIYIRFKDEEGNLSPADELAFDIIEYQMGELFSIKIFPLEVTIPVNNSYLFTLHGYDLKLNEVPLDSSKATWTKSCGVGSLSPEFGLATTYTAPSISGKRNISAYYNKLGTGAIINVVAD